MEIKKIAVLGVGTIGYQIAQLCAQYGYTVNLRDIDDNLVQSGLEAIKKGLKKFFVDKGKMSQEEADAVYGRIRGFTDLKSAVEDVDLVIEAIPEKMELKQRVFKELDENCPTHTILTSNTSSLSPTAIGSLVNRKEKILVTHFINPVQVIKLVEVVKAEKTSEETIQTVKSFLQKMEKEPVVIKDSPGFITTRLFVVIVNEAIKMLDEGIASVEDIDKAVKVGLNHPIPPLRAADVSMDTALYCLEYLRDNLGKEYTPSPLLEKMVREGKLGVKVGEGFYKYTSKV
jgi:3-hydroxybutyryl-CoA dehydrogenase